ncbi:uncharacterized protein L203_102047 [Cryptococcus depauperatus CBS 7841]|uniref:Uncharacterized protein n=1 Tax=Cryptococcus depauperatus CBS 7841 TaxID=1295531 RepID=A0AAJ8JR33_9TREE
MSEARIQLNIGNGTQATNGAEYNPHQSRYHTQAPQIVLDRPQPYHESWRPKPRETCDVQNTPELSNPGSDTGLPTPSLTASSWSINSVSDLRHLQQQQHHNETKSQSASPKSIPPQEQALDSLARLRQFKAEVEASRQARGASHDMKPAELAQMAESFLASQQQSQSPQPDVQAQSASQETLQQMANVTSEEEREKLVREHQLKEQLKARAKGEDAHKLKEQSPNSKNGRPRAEDLMEADKATRSDAVTSNTSALPDIPLHSPTISKQKTSLSSSRAPASHQSSTSLPQIHPPSFGNYTSSEDDSVPEKHSSGGNGVVDYRFGREDFTTNNRKPEIPLHERTRSKEMETHRSQDYIHHPKPLEREHPRLHDSRSLVDRIAGPQPLRPRSPSPARTARSTVSYRRPISPGPRERHYQSAGSPRRYLDRSPPLNAFSPRPYDTPFDYRRVPDLHDMYRDPRPTSDYRNFRNPRDPRINMLETRARGPAIDERNSRDPQDSYLQPPPFAYDRRDYDRSFPIERDAYGRHLDYRAASPPVNENVLSTIESLKAQLSSLQATALQQGYTTAPILREPERVRDYAERYDQPPPPRGYARAMSPPPRRLPPSVRRPISPPPLRRPLSPARRPISPPRRPISPGRSLPMDRAYPPREYPYNRLESRINPPRKRGLSFDRDDGRGPRIRPIPSGLMRDRM